MSETAQTLIKGALRAIQAIATGETPTNDELQDGLEAMKIMLRHWSAKNIRIYYVKQDTITLTGATSYTIGSGGDVNTVRPVSIRGAYVRDSGGVDRVLKIIDEAWYRGLVLKSLSSTVEYLYYNPDYPLGIIYVYPTGGVTIYLDSLKPLTDPTSITSSIAFPPEYDEAIKYGLAVRLAPEYGKEPPQIVIALAQSGLNDIETRNFAQQINATRLELLRLSGRYNIDEG